MAGRCRSAERERVRGGWSWRGRSGGRNGSAVGRPASHSHGEAKGGLGRGKETRKKEIGGGLLTGMGRRFAENRRGGLGPGRGMEGAREGGVRR